MSSPAARPANWKALAPKPHGITYQSQHKLPPLPVPPLKATLEKLRTSLRPLARDSNEYSNALRKIGDFEHTLAPELQKRLEERSQEPGREHWLEEWWDDLAYMGYRDSVVINVSYYYGFDANPLQPTQSQAARAAGITRSALLFRRKLLQAQMPPDEAKQGPLCMDSWRWMFDACRIPAKPSDWAITYANESHSGLSGHIIALRKGRVWKVPATVDGRLITTAELQSQFNHIIENTKDNYTGVGVLTASNRDVWTDDYAHLHQSAKNTAILKDIHSSAFVVCLDSDSPEGPVDFSRALWHGGVQGQELGNRWCDKPVQFIVFENGKAGIMGEHSVMDGTPTTRMCDEVLDALYSPDFDHGSSEPSISIQKPEPLDWEITTEIETAVQKAQVSSSELVATQALGYHLTDYGKDVIKKFGYSPDSWTQMIVQLAYHRFRKGDPLNGGTYEAATTRRFLKGRTEAIRIVTDESRAWVQAMDDEGLDTAEKRQLFDVATKRHLTDAKEAGMALGIDRHLLGLRMLVKESEQVPAMYEDPVYVRAKHWVLSTSAIFSKHFPVYGWGEVVPDGFGVAYMTGYKDRLQFTITSRKEMPNEEFVKEISKAAIDLKYLFEADESGKSKL